MHPILFSIGSFPIHSYGVLIAIGFVLAVLHIKHNAKQLNWNTEQIVDYCFVSLLVGFVGARSVFVITQFEYFLSNPLEVFYVWEGGLVFYGGPLAVIPLTIWFARKNNYNLYQLGDIGVQGLTLAHAIGRLGCLAAGCCHGSACSYPWAIRLDSPLVEDSLRGLPTHPVQLYESAALALLFLCLKIIYKRQRFKGQTMLVYFMAYPLIRSVTEIFRGDTVRGFIIGDWLSTSQFISLLIFLGAAAIYLRQIILQNKRQKPCAN